LPVGLNGFEILILFSLFTFLFPSIFFLLLCCCARVRFYERMSRSRDPDDSFDRFALRSVWL
jgi:hypothetical protein